MTDVRRYLIFNPRFFKTSLNFSNKLMTSTIGRGSYYSEKIENTLRPSVIADDIEKRSHKKLLPQSSKTTAIFSQEFLRNMDRLESYGFQKDRHVYHNHTEIQAITRKVCRAVMRNPSHAIKVELCRLHGMIKKEFMGMPDAEIEWLLGGAPTARGSFNSAAHFNYFFSLNPQRLSSSRLITALESIITAIAYRAIDASWTLGPVHPSVYQDGFIIRQKIHRMFDKKVISDVNRGYPLRTMENIHSTLALKSQSIVTHPDDDSDVSDDDECVPKKKLNRALPSRHFRVRLHSKNKKKTWPAAACDGNIPIRAHVSGTCPISLSVIETLYERNGCDWFTHDKHASALAGALLMPTYERGDYHTIAETTAGLLHYLEERAGIDFSVHSPRECLMRGLGCIADATEGELKTVLDFVSRYVLSKTTEVDVLVRPNLEESFEILKEAGIPVSDKIHYSSM